jgi:Flp pilus assembly pilin Flp
MRAGEVGVEDGRMMQPRKSFCSGEEGQDLVEYSLLLAFVCLVGAAMYMGIATSTTSIWSIVNTRLAAANQ